MFVSAFFLFFSQYYIQYSLLNLLQQQQNYHFMYVVNFDFTDHILPLKILAINIPVVLTQIVTYPLQRLQTLLVSQSSMITNTQWKQARLIIKNMISIQGFPKLLHGMRYTVDYMGTQMTTKFLMFDFLVAQTMNSIKQHERWKIITYCFIANLMSTAMSQIAFNYQTIASSLPISKLNRPEDVKIKLSNYTTKNKLPINGLRYTLPASLINTTLQLIILNKAVDWLSSPNFYYIFNDLLSAFAVFSSTAFVSHYAFQRQVQICAGLPNRSIPYSRGLIGSLLRYNLKGLMLFSLYFLYFQWKTKQQIQSLLPERQTFTSQPQPYRKK